MDIEIMVVHNEEKFQMFFIKQVCAFLLHGTCFI